MIVSVPACVALANIRGPFAFHSQRRGAGANLISHRVREVAMNKIPAFGALYNTADCDHAIWCRRRADRPRPVAVQQLFRLSAGQQAWRVESELRLRLETG